MGTLSDFQKAAATMVIAGGNADVAAGRVRLMGAHVGGADASSLSIYNAATAAGAAVITIRAAAAGSNTVWFGPSGIRFANGISTGSTGTTPNKQLFYVVD